MEIEEIKNGVTTDTIEQILSGRDFAILDEYRMQYDPKLHAIADPVKHKDIWVNTGTEAEPKMDQVKVNRIPLPLQRKIVNTAKIFLCGNPIGMEYTAKNEIEESMVEVIERVIEQNKLDYDNKELCELMMSETECAELWYTEEVGDDEEYWQDTPNQGMKWKLRMKILAHSKGDLLYPVFNKFGDMVAFGRGYMLMEEKKEVQYFDLYTKEKIYSCKKMAGGWEIKESINIIGKIPIIYYSQPYPEWHYVQEIIDRLELSISKHGDDNDYNGSPTTLVEGEVIGFAKKGESGKVLQLENGAKVSQLTNHLKPESVEMEQQNLERLLYELSGTLRISLEELKGLGHFSIIALKMYFMPAHMKAADKEQIFGKAMQRRFNYLKKACSIINLELRKASSMSIKPKFNYYMPENVQEMMEVLSVAKTHKLLSDETIAKNTPYVVDATEELELIRAQAIDEEMETEI